MKKTPSRRSGLVLPLHRIWLLSLPFRWATRAPAPGFAPGLRNVLAYEKGRLWHLLHEREPRRAHDDAGFWQPAPLLAELAASHRTFNA